MPSEKTKKSTAIGLGASAAAAVAIAGYALYKGVRHDRKQRAQQQTTSAPYSLHDARDGGTQSQQREPQPVSVAQERERASSNFESGQSTSYINRNDTGASTQRANFQQTTAHPARSSSDDPTAGLEQDSYGGWRSKQTGGPQVPRYANGSAELTAAMERAMINAGLNPYG